ncbi:aromatic acid/H+ symport family MFS transporter [Paraburkholderia sp. MMS20-SJTR3]|uniref:Aromatic acid/H+ symport family MFS transporter n=1 Tax=Paraburkholderia sejongensis TaxID=2886946 RepID=A0ABS8JSJ2_9BURK|nr:aromatic acid/H+ symport family MFS transporter [Paraburkholderia sp. MMS20-SJTR3]MCC8392879.1 aromatic acid/H+ symport family MFS transporter [Paraburkholderia sp. MMS20-SJTR3]
MHVADAAAESPAQTIPLRTTCLVLALCWVAIVSEGYDIGVMGTIVPSLLADTRWHLTPLELGQMSSAALIGTLFGAYFISLLSDLAGRKQLLIGCVALFSLSMLGAVWAPTPAIFALVRGIGGLGLGGVISVAAALTIEYSPPKRRNLNFAIMYSGYPIGALVSALSGIAFIQSFGWRAVVAIGATPLLFVPALMMWLPESLEFLVRNRRHDEARMLAARLGMSEPAPDMPGAQKKAQFREVLREVFSRKNAMGTLCLWVAQFMAIMLVYGLGTWLPQIMRKNGYDLGSSLAFFAVFNLAAAVGGVVIGRIADRFGPRLTISSAFLVGALSIAALSYKNVMALNYLLVACAGFGSIAVALVLLGYVANYYAPHARASGTGWAVGVGRFGAMCGPVIGGYLAGLNVSPAWNFVMFATTALIASLAVMLTPTPEHVRRARDA